MIAIDDPLVLRWAQAMAKAEGFGPPQNLPTRINNPCDLELGDRGFGTQAGKTVFNDLADGWAAACHESWLMLTGNSHFYNPIKTFLQIAVLYTGNDNAQAWATTASGAISLKPNNTLQNYLEANGAS